MIKIGTKSQLNNTNISLPLEVFEECLEIVTILDEEYGEDRDIETALGGYIAFVDSITDFKLLLQNNLNVEEDIFESIKFFKTNEGNFYSVLYLLGSDFAINIITDVVNTPENILDKWRI